LTALAQDITRQLSLKPDVPRKRAQLFGASHTEHMDDLQRTPSTSSSMATRRNSDRDVAHVSPHSMMSRRASAGNGWQLQARHASDGSVNSRPPREPAKDLLRKHLEQKGSRQLPVSSSETAQAWPRTLTSSLQDAPSPVQSFDTSVSVPSHKSSCHMMARTSSGSRSCNVSGRAVLNSTSSMQKSQKMMWDELVGLRERLCKLEASRARPAPAAVTAEVCQAPPVQETPLVALTSNGGRALSPAWVPPKRLEKRRTTIVTGLSQVELLEVERGHRKRLEEENRDLRVKLRKCERVVQRLTKELEDMFARVPMPTHKRPGRVSFNVPSAAPRRTSTSSSLSSTASPFLKLQRAVSGFFVNEDASSDSSTHADSDESPPIKLCWETSPLSKFISLSSDRLTATRVGSEDSGCAFIGICAPPVIEDSQGYGFEVRVTKVRHEEQDGLAIGFTTTPPVSWPTALPPTADLLPGDIWLVGYDGEFYDSTVANDDGKWQECPFNTANLREGDRIAVQVSRGSGFLEAGINGKVLWTTHLPAVKNAPALYGIVDLLGNTVEVVLIDE